MLQKKLSIMTIGHAYVSEHEAKHLVSLCFAVHVGNGRVDENPTIKINLLNMKS